MPSRLYRSYVALTHAPWLPAVPLVLVQLVSGMWYMPQQSFLPIYLEEQLGLTPVVIAGLVAGGQVASMVAALLGGVITDMIGSKWVLVAGLAGAGISSLVFQVHAPWLAAALWFVGGAGLALQTLGGASYLTRLNARGSLGVLSAIYALSLTLGGSIGNPVAGLILDRRGFHVFGLAVIALTGATTFAAALFMPRLGDRPAEHAPLRAFWTGALAIVRRPGIQMLLGLRCLPTVFYGMSVVLIPLLINGLANSKTTVAAYATASLIVASIVQLLAGRAADRFGARGPTLAGYAFLILAALGLAATAGKLWGLFIFGIMGIAAAWALAALMYLWVSDGVPTAEHAWAFGLLHAVWSLSMVTGSLLGGWLVRSVVGLPFLVAGVMNVGSLFLTLAYYAHISWQARQAPVTETEGLS